QAEHAGRQYFDAHVSVDRVNGYKQSLAAHNIAVRDEWIVDGGYTHETALQAARELLSQSPLPEAVFATDSLKLMSIYRAAAEKNGLPAVVLVERVEITIMASKPEEVSARASLFG
ncbi:hypothetical protein ACUOA5_10535, partial [Escherichia coli]